MGNGGLRVVLVDDSQLVIRKLMRILQPLEGVEVVGTAREGGSAVRIVKEERPDFVLLDMMMPGMDGYATLRTLRSVAPGVRAAVLSSIGSDPAVAAEARRLGAVDVLAKPFDESTVAELIGRELLVKRASAPGEETPS